MPFEWAAELLSFFWATPVSEPTVRRHAEAAGAAWVEVQQAQVEQLERTLPDPPPGPPLQQLSVDGAMVPLLGGEWAEVKTLAIGTVETTEHPGGLPEVQTREWSYFSRLADAQTFTRQALVEVYRRGTACAGQVVAPVDGSPWCQSFLDMHRPDAVRILDFPHALEHLSRAAQASFGPGTAETSAWLGEQAHQLKHADPDQVLAALRALPVAHARDPAAAAEVRDGTLAYFEARRAQIDYAHFQAQGFPIGSGSVESANKLVVEARLKGSGMHWARNHVNPMLALRTIVCARRWDEAWPRIEAQLRAQARRRRSARRQVRQPDPPPSPAPSASPPPAAPRNMRQSTRVPTIVNGRPTAQHPWKKYPLLTPRHHRAKT
jgi:hypothetical protein